MFLVALLTVIAIPLALLSSNFVLKGANRPSIGRFIGAPLAFLVIALGAVVLNSSLQSVLSGDTLAACRLCSTHLQRASQPTAFWLAVMFWYCIGAFLAGSGIGLMRNLFHSRWREP